MMLFAATLALLAAMPPPTPWQDLGEEERAKVIAELRERPLEERIEQMSARFLEVPYVYSPLGEGEGPDSDPPMRFDAADCLSLVEESIALSLSAHYDQFGPWLERIRYGADVSYEGRNHLMEAQWLPHLEDLGILRDVTRRYGGKDTETGWTVITPASWRSPSSKELGLPPERQRVGTFAFNVIPLGQVQARIKTVPTGTLFVVVREERPFKVTRMTHLGFIVQQKGRTFLRHASKSRHHRVVDEDLSEFLARNARYDKWPVTGIALYQVQEPTEMPTPPAPRADASLRSSEEAWPLPLPLPPARLPGGPVPETAVPRLSPPVLAPPSAQERESPTSPASGS